MRNELRWHCLKCLRRGRSELWRRERVRLWELRVHRLVVWLTVEVGGWHCLKCPSRERGELRRRRRAKLRECRDSVEVA